MTDSPLPVTVTEVERADPTMPTNEAGLRVTQDDREAVVSCHTLMPAIEADILSGNRDHHPWVQGMARQRLSAFAAGERAGIERGHAALLPFTSHSVGCAIYQRSWALGAPPCTCGLDAARNLSALIPGANND
jgi:hypothetical protein